MPLAVAANPMEECGMDGNRLAKIADWQQALVDGGHLPMAISVVSRHGKVAYVQATGYSDAENKVPIKEDDIFRLYSMTKPPVAVALLMLYEEGRFQLDDPVHYFLGPKWKKENCRVFDEWTDIKACEYTTVECDRDITMRHVLTHTAGLGHGFDRTGVGIQTDRVYAKEWVRPSPKTVAPEDQSMLAAFIDGLGDMPLLYQPGTQWNYSHAPDVQGRLIEVLSGQQLDVFLEERMFKPLGMKDTGFDVPPEKVDRFTHCYSFVPPGGGAGGGIQLRESEADVSEVVSGDASITFPHVGGFRDNGPEANANYLYCGRPKMISGTGGMVGTAADYAAFCNMLLAGGVAPSGERLLGVKTIEFATSNQLPDSKGLLDMIIDPKVQYSETAGKTPPRPSDRSHCAAFLSRTALCCSQRRRLRPRLFRRQVAGRGGPARLRRQLRLGRRRVDHLLVRPGGGHLRRVLHAGDGHAAAQHAPGASNPSVA